MKIESTAFTQADVDSFLDEQLDHERSHLVERLEAASARLMALAPRIPEGRSDGDAWTAHETLAHVAVLSKFYGVMVHRVASGKMTEVDLLANVNLRDVAGDQMAAMTRDELLQAIRADHERTAQLLRTAEPAALRRSVTLTNGDRVTAEFIARYPLINHLEQHVDQLERLVS
ncbi:MAG TPA: DinB family protein [Candidatus Dormibacteraeota bacterium]|nr:DinB family protein [Candidatus Dormibacteraeota bacterium]